MKNLLAVVVATAMLSASLVNAGTLGPAPQIIAKYDRSFIERSGAQTFGEMLDTGIIRYFFTGGRNLLVLVNGRPYATTAHNLDTIPLSAVESIEVLRAEGLGTLGGHASIRGAFNLVLRKDLDGFDVRTVTRLPSRDGGDAHQGSVVWGNAFETGGHVTVGVDILKREEIVGSTRDHSRSEWTEDGDFAETKNVSIGGNTVFVFDVSERKLRAVPLGECDPALGYTGPLSNPSGITSGDKGCGYAYGNVWWDSGSYEQENAILNLNRPLGEDTELHVDANVTQGRGAFRYAPSIDVFTVRPSQALLDAINESASNADPMFVADQNQDFFAIGHRFLGHGNRDWESSTEEFDVSASVKGRFTENLGYDARISAYEYDGSVLGDTFVDAGIIGQEIAAGNYDLTDPLSKDPLHLEAIEKSSLREHEDLGSRYFGLRFALEGTGVGVGGRNSAWTAGVELSKVAVHRLQVFRANDGRPTTVNNVLGSGGTSFTGERKTAGAFAEVSVPLADSLDVRAAARADDYNDIGGLRAWRLGAEYHQSDAVTLRASLSKGDGAPSMYHLRSTESQGHPYVLCIPASGPPPRTCDRVNLRQVERLTSGNPELKPSNSKRHSIGFENRKGPFYFVVDWYRLTTSNLPGQHTATWAILNYPECPNGGTNCIERMAGDITIHDSFANIVETRVSGVNVRFGNRFDTDWGFVASRGFWRYVAKSELETASAKQSYPLPRNAVRIVNSVGRGNFTAFWALNYRDSFDNLEGGEFGAWTGHDLTFDWKQPFGFEDMRLTAGVYNITDAKLSTDTVNPSLSDGPRAAGWGRTLFVTLNMRF